MIGAKRFLGFARNDRQGFARNDKRAVSCLLMLLLPLWLGAQTQAQRYIEKMAKEEPLRSAAWGVLAVNARGDTLAKWNHLTKLVPASNMKLVTTGTALHRLGGGYRFETVLAYDGTVADSTLHGNLYLVGGGDPTLGAEDAIALPTDTLFARWKALLQGAGIRAIDGYVIGDGRWITDDPEHGGWNIEDAYTYYGTGMDGLCFHENNIDFRVEPGDSIGAPPVFTRTSRAETPWLIIRNHATTGAKQTGNSLYFHTSELAPVAEWRGSLAIDRKKTVESVSNKFGAMTAAYAFCTWLDTTGFTVIDGPADINRSGLIRDFRSAPTLPARPVDSLTRIGSTFSPTLASIIGQTNGRSDNFYAEAILRVLGRQVRGRTDYDAAIAAEKAVLGKIGVSTGNSVRLSDGSGLARTNYASPDFFVRFLKGMWRTSARSTFLASLPRPGSKGTLQNMFQKAGKDFKARIRMKSGSMNGVLCYSGYLLPTGGGTGADANVITFSILTNNASAGAAKVRPILEELIRLLAEEN